MKKNKKVVKILEYLFRVKIYVIILNGLGEKK